MNSSLIKLLDLLNNDPKLFFVPLVLLLAGAIISHLFARRLKADELLFNARKNTYQKFINEYSNHFPSPKRNLIHASFFEMDRFLSDGIFSGLKDETFVEYLTTKKEISRLEGVETVRELFANCRLLAGQELYLKLRKLERILEEHKFDYVSIPKNVEVKYAVTYLQVETLMRRELKVAGWGEILTLHLMPAYAFFHWKLPVVVTNLSAKLRRR